MARPMKCRRICEKPAYDCFAPEGIAPNEKVILTLDEYEVIRLIDYEKQTHAECAKQMGISRSTVTDIYENARFKIADSLVHGKTLQIAGGHYRLCDGAIAGTCFQKCQKIHRLPVIERKEEVDMRIAVTYEEGMIFPHFGRTQAFKFYDVEDGKMVKSQVVSTNGQGHGALVGFLADAQVDVLICGGLGMGAQNALKATGITLLGGVSGSADEAVDAYRKGDLSYDPDAHCDHHSHEHGCGEHTCHD